MSGTIRTYQKCPRCNMPFPSSIGDFPIICNPCMTQPTKYFINIWYRGESHDIFYDLKGKTFHSWAHVNAILGKIRSEKEDKIFNPIAYKKQSNTSFRAFWQRFLDGYSGSTYDKIKAIGVHHLTYFNDFQMRDILSWHIDEWWRDLQKKGLANSYCNDIQTWLRSFFNNALRLDIIEKLPKFPKFLDVDPPEVDEWLTEEEQLAVLDALPKYDRPIFDFLFLTGVRVNEAIALRYSDINYVKKIITIRNTIKRNGTLGRVKNKKSRRIPYGAVRKCFNKTIIGIGGYVFINKWGRRYSDDYLRTTFYRICNGLGIKKVKLKNATRHSFGMGLLRKGYDIWQASKIMGHSDIKITEHYAKMMDKEIQGAYGRTKLKELEDIKAQEI